MLSKMNDYYSNKMCFQGDTHTVIYFSWFGLGKGATTFLKNKLKEQPKSLS